MDEHRNAPRHRVLKAGTIGFGGSAINCMVRNISDTGAMLNVTNPVEVPEQFTLALPADGQHMSCHVVWRREKRIGVAFYRLMVSRVDLALFGQFGSCARAGYGPKL
jgi:hypothetical protein